mgnify:CR=1 FL=1
MTIFLAFCVDFVDSMQWVAITSAVFFFYLGYYAALYILSSLFIIVTFAKILFMIYVTVEIIFLTFPFSIKLLCKSTVSFFLYTLSIFNFTEYPYLDLCLTLVLITFFLTCFLFLYKLIYKNLYTDFEIKSILIFFSEYMYTCINIYNYLWKFLIKHLVRGYAFFINAYVYSTMWFWRFKWLRKYNKFRWRSKFRPNCWMTEIQISGRDIPMLTFCEWALLEYVWFCYKVNIQDKYLDFDYLGECYIDVTYSLDFMLRRVLYFITSSSTVFILYSTIYAICWFTHFLFLYNVGISLNNYLCNYFNLLYIFFIFHILLYYKIIGLIFLIFSIFHSDKVEHIILYIKIFFKKLIVYYAIFLRISFLFKQSLISKLHFYKDRLLIIFKNVVFFNFLLDTLIKVFSKLSNKNLCLSPNISVFDMRIVFKLLVFFKKTNLMSFLTKIDKDPIIAIFILIRLYNMFLNINSKKVFLMYNYTHYFTYFIIFLKKTKNISNLTTFYKVNGYLNISEKNLSNLKELPVLLAYSKKKHIKIKNIIKGYGTVIFYKSVIITNIYKKKDKIFKKNRELLLEPNYSNTSINKYLNLNYIKNFNFQFLRKNRVYNKGRYSRTRQNYRTGVYMCMYLSVISILGLYYTFFGFVFNFSYLWWFFISFIASFLLPKIIKYRLYEPYTLFYKFFDFFYFLKNLFNSRK